MFEQQSLILMDLEFTCWEDSLRTGWARPDRPPEVLEVGLVAYDMISGRTIDTYQSYVKPMVNPKLSSYCKKLLRISQTLIDESLQLREVAAEIDKWLTRLGMSYAPTCAWGEEDRQYWDGDVNRSNAVNPFSNTSHINLELFFKDVLNISGTEVLERKQVRELLTIPKNSKRHAALPDALELVEFCTTLKSKGSKYSAPLDKTRCSGRSVTSF